MGVKISFLFLLIATFGLSTNARHLERFSEVPSSLSTSQKLCEGIQPEEIEDVFHQLELADKYEVNATTDLVLLLNNNLDKTIELFRRMKLAYSGVPGSIVSSDPKDEEYSKKAKESIFHYRMNEEGPLFYAFPGIQEIENEVFAKYIAYKVTDKAQNMKIALIDIFSENPSDHTNLSNSGDSSEILKMKIRKQNSDRIKNLFENAVKIIPNVSQYNGSIAFMSLHDIGEYYSDFWVYVYNFDGDHVMNCEECTKLDISLYMGHFLKSVLSGASIPGKFQTATNDMSFMKDSEKHLNFTFSMNPRLTQILKCVESKLEDNLTSDITTLITMINTYHSDLRKDFMQAGDLLEKLQEKNLNVSLKNAMIVNQNDSNMLLSKMIHSFRLLEIDNGDEILSRIGKKTEHLNFLQSGTSDRLYASELLEPVIDLYENTILKSILLYQDLLNLYKESNHSTTDDFGRKMDLKTFMESALETETRCVPTEGSDLDYDIGMAYKLQLHGSIVRFADIPDLTTDPCEGEINSIEIFARNMIFIDKNFSSLGKPMQLAAFAPKWWVVGEKTINLSGADGKAHEEEFAANGAQGMPGDDGLAGLPGAPGGRFVGLSGKIFNANMLRIFANGGNGGPGQGGGEGGVAVNPRSPDLSDENNNDILRIVHDNLFGGCRYSVRQVSYGGKGGNGGIGGHKGNAGEIVLIQINKNSTVSENATKISPVEEVMLSSLDGKDGTAGDFGKGGVGKLTEPAKPSASIKKKNCPREILNDTSVIVTRHAPHAINGENGTSGVSLENEQYAVEFKNFRGFAYVVNDYKNFIRPYLNTTNKTEVTKFFEDIINNESVNSKYETLELLDELRGLEGQYTDLMGKMNLAFMYENLYKRMVDYARHRSGSEEDEDFVIALGYGYTAALSKANRLQDTGGLKAGFIYNIQKYLEKVSENLSDLKKDTVQYTANEIGTKYQKDLMRNIEEAQGLIQKQLRHDIQKTDRLMKKKIMDLFIEVRDLRGKTDSKRADLKKAMKQQALFAVLKFALVGAACFVPGGQVAAPLVFSAIQAGENFLLKNLDDKHTTKIPSSVGKQMKGSYEFMKESREEQLQELEEQRQYLKNQRRKLGFRNQTLGIDQKEAEVGNELKRLEEHIGKTIEKEKKEENNGLKLSTGVAIMSKVASYVAHKKFKSITTDISKQAGKVKELEKDLESVDKDLENIQRTERNIFDQFEPVIRTMFNDLPTDGKLSGKSPAALDVSKWKVQKTLKIVKSMVESFTEGFDVGKELVQLTGTVEETMNTLIGIYDQIQNYQKEMRLIAYIDRVHSSDLKHLRSGNQALEKSVYETRMIIQKNVAFIQYERALKSFKQFVFPYAREFFEESTKPAALELQKFDDISSFINVLLEKIKYMKGKLDNLHVIKKQFFTTRKIDRNTLKQKGIYILKNEDHNEIISNLLDGEEVILYLDPRKSPYHAVKLRDIKVDFLAKDEKYQKVVDEKLGPLDYNMTHMGNSYYTCGNKMYLISHERIDLYQTFDEEAQNNEVYKKNIVEGNGMASPFATWRVKLKGMKLREDKNYLAELKNKVDLIFEGTFDLVEEDGEVCNAKTDLSEYYRQYDSMLDVPAMNSSQ